MHTLFLHADVQDPYTVYRQRLASAPVYWDEQNQLWALYSYAVCSAVLQHEHAYIPAVDAPNAHGLNEYALSIKEHLVRLQNGKAHIVARSIAMQLHQCMWPVEIAEVAAQLIGAAATGGVIDWGTVIAKQLPVRVLLKSFGFEQTDEAMIAAQLPVLATIMWPHKTPDQVNGINAIAKEIYGAVEAHLLKKGIAPGNDDSLLPLYVSNCIGLFIQSYDAGRGLLCNALLSLLEEDNIQAAVNNLRQAIVETLRFNPPVHNTRRVAAGAIELDGVAIPEGAAMLVVLAAANRDAMQFVEPDRFHINRANNHQHLSFGAGIHACLADHFVTQLVQECLLYLFTQYKKIALIETPLQYERLVNARLVKRMLIKIF